MKRKATPRSIDYRAQKRSRGNNGEARSASIPRSMPFSKSAPSRVNAVELSFETNDLLNQSSALLPYNYSYFVLTQPQKSKNGLATVVPFFTAWQSMYRKYRVRGFTVMARFANSEAFTIIPFIAPKNSQPALATVAEFSSYTSNINTRKSLLGGSTGMNVKFLNYSDSVSHYTGFASTNVEDAYVGLTDGSSPPTDNIYAIVGTDNNGAASVMGVLASVIVKFSIDFMEVQTPLN